jgi:hypothetical protein
MADGDDRTGDGVGEGEQGLLERLRPRRSPQG